MRTYLECIPCVMTQGLNAARLATPDEKVHEQVLRALSAELAEADWSGTPMALGRIAQRLVEELTGRQDPYLSVRERCNAEALALYPRLKQLVRHADDPLLTAVKIAVAGNIIDFGVASHEFDVEDTLQEVLSSPFAVDDYEPFVRQLSGGRTVLYLADNAGEIVFDRILIEQMKDIQDVDVTVAVKNEPFINDAVLTDARASGLNEAAQVIEVPLYPETSEQMRQAWESADVIIAKGQANYEAYSEMDGPLFFLLLAKCDVLAKHIGVGKGDMVLLDGAKRRAKQPHH